MVGPPSRVPEVIAVSGYSDEEGSKYEPLLKSVRGSSVHGGRQIVYPKNDAMFRP